MHPALPPDLYATVRTLISGAQAHVARQVNATIVELYWQIGRLIVEDEQRGADRAEYGKAVLQDLSKRLTAEFGKGYDASNLRYMRLAYQAFPIRDAVRHELTWTHFKHLTRVKDATAREWYMHEAAAQNWSSRALDRQISVLYYERLLGSTASGESVRQEAAALTAPLAASPLDFLRDPYVFEFLGLQPAPHLHERDLETGLLTHLQGFLLELGKGFAFVARQQRLSVGRTDFYVDLVFYNYLLRCFVLVDLKIGPLTHQDVGQMDTYVRVYEDLHKLPGDNPTLGLVLCSDKDDAVVKYSFLSESQQLFAARYLLHLPTEEELRTELRRDRARLEAALDRAGAAEEQ